MLRKNVLATLCYFDCLDYPPTLFETWQHLLAIDESESGSVSFGEVLRVVDTLSQEGEVQVTHGFVTIPQRTALVAERLRAEKVSVQKLKRAKKLARFIAWVPWVRMIGITGSLSMKKGAARSDWDFFVVLATGRIWIGRTVLTAILHLLGKRRHGKYVENRACLNYFVTEAGLEINPKDLFAAHEYRYLLPLFGWETFLRFERTNAWMKRFKPLTRLTEIAPLWTFVPPSGSLTRFLENLFSLPRLETWLGQWQRKKIEKNPKTQWPGSFIQTTDRALIFLPRPKGPEIFEQFKLRLSERRL